MSRRSGRRMPGPAALALACLAAAGCTEPPAPPPPPPPQVTVAFPERRAVTPEEFFNGWTAAVETVEVRSRVRGHIEQVHFRDGDLVKAGDLLFTLDPRPFQADVDAARAEQRALEAQLVAAQKERVRLEDLLGKGGASQKQVEKAQADAEALEARIAATAAQVQRLALDLEYARITSPIAGRVSRALLTAGNLVGAGGADPLLTTVVSVDPIFVYFDVPETSLLRNRTRKQAQDPQHMLKPVADLAMPFQFALDTDAGWPREGQLDFAENVVDAGTGTLRVRGRAANADGYLVAGARVRVRVPCGEPEDSLLLPDAALQADQSLRYVLVAGPDDKVLRRDVRPGRLLDDGMRVLLPAGKEGEGVQPGERVIVEGQARARLHAPVEALDREGRPVPAGGAGGPAAK